MQLQDIVDTADPVRIAIGSAVVGNLLLQWKIISYLSDLKMKINMMWDNYCERHDINGANGRKRRK